LRETQALAVPASAALIAKTLYRLNRFVVQEA